MARIGQGALLYISRKHNLAFVYKAGVNFDANSHEIEKKILQKKRKRESNFIHSRLLGSIDLRNESWPTTRLFSASSSRFFLFTLFYNTWFFVMSSSFKFFHDAFTGHVALQLIDRAIEV